MSFEESRLTDFKRNREQTKLKVLEGVGAWLVGLAGAAPKVKKIYGGKKHDTTAGVDIRMGLFWQGQSVSNAPPLSQGSAAPARTCASGPDNANVAEGENER